MPENGTINDQERINALVNKALGRQLRPIALVGLILCAIGYVMGHHVAMSHAASANRGLKAQVDDLQQQLARLENRADQQEAAQTSLSATIEQQRRLREDEIAEIRKALGGIIASATPQHAVSTNPAAEETDAQLSIDDEPVRLLMTIQQTDARQSFAALPPLAPASIKPAETAIAAPAAGGPDAGRRKGYLFFAPKRPARLDTERVGIPDLIPLPPVEIQ